MKNLKGETPKILPPGLDPIAWREAQREKMIHQELGERPVTMGSTGDLDWDQVERARAQARRNGHLACPD